MARPVKCRKVCHYPTASEFRPCEGGGSLPPVTLTVDEYEAVRLLDKEGLSQEQCCLRMQVARTTVQKIYESARRKIAAALTEGRILRIEGGDFHLCRGDDSACSRKNCFKQQYHQQYKKPKGACIMRIAVTYENGNIFQHFGHTEQFKVYDVENGQIVSSQVVDACGSGHGALAGVLTALHADALICGGIGGGARMALEAANIQLYGGVSGSADEAARALAAGELTYNPDVRCNHHDHHHGEGHTCGSHGCGEHHCGHHD